MANIDDYLVASYRCRNISDNGSGESILKDLSGNGHDITLYGDKSTSFNPEFEGAFVANGVDNYGVCGNMPFLDDFTVVCKRRWIKTEGYTNNAPLIGGGYNHGRFDEYPVYANFTLENFYYDNIHCIVEGLYQNVKKYFDPSNDVVYMTKGKYDGKCDFDLNPPFIVYDVLRKGNFYLFREDMSFEGYANVALYALDIYDRTLDGEDLKKAISKMDELVVNWKDGVGEVTDQPLTVNPGSGSGDKPVSFGSVMNNGLDRTLEMEITTPKGTKKTLIVNQEGCRQAYITSDGKRWLTSDNRVYGVLKGDAPCECFDITPGVVRLRIDDADPNPLIQSCGDSSWIKGRRCLVKKTDAGVVVCYLDGNNSELFHDGTPAKLDGTMGQWMTDIPSYRYSHKGGEYDVSDIQNIQDIVHNITLTHDDADDSITEWGNKGLFRRCLVGVTKAVNIDNKLWSKKGGESTGYLTHSGSHNYATALGGGFDIIDYETHCKIAHLFYAKYANRNPQGMNQFGTGSYGVGRTIGTTSSLGNNDGKTSTQISFLGIEDFYGCMYEWMSGIHSKGSVSYIYDGFEPGKVPTADYRTVDVFYPGFTSKVLWGEYGDMLPVRADASVTTHYCDKCSNLTTEWGVMLRSGINNYETGGVVSLSKDNMFNYSIKDEYAKSSRIQYRGLIQIIENPAEFIAMPIGF